METIISTLFGIFGIICLVIAVVLLLILAAAVIKFVIKEFWNEI